MIFQSSITRTVRYPRCGDLSKAAWRLSFVSLRAASLTKGVVEEERNIKKKINIESEREGGGGGEEREGCRRFSKRKTKRFGMYGDIISGERYEPEKDREDDTPSGAASVNLNRERLRVDSP